MDLLEKLLGHGFTPRSFPAYARHLGVEKNNFVALLELRPDGQWAQFSSGGYLLEGQIGLLVDRGGRKFFVHKSKQVPAEGELLEAFRIFLDELRGLLSEQSSQ